MTKKVAACSRTTRRASTLATLLLLAASAASPAGFDKEAAHREMEALARRLEVVGKQARTDPRAAEGAAAARARYRELSALLGGDDPARLLAASAASRRPTVAQVVPTLPAGCSGSTATFTQATPTGIPTAPAVVTSTVVVSGVGPYLFDLDLTTNLVHTWSSDLDVTLTSPAGTVVTLTTDNARIVGPLGNEVDGLENVFNGTLWDDDADPDGQVPYVTNAGLVTDHPYVNLTTGTPLVPEEAMAAFLGEDPNGTWTLTISDDAGGDGGSLDSWSLAVTTLPAPPVVTVHATMAQDIPTAIPSQGVVTSTLVVAGITPSALLDVDLTTNITHSFAADLDITLMSPAGTVVTLTTDNGADNDDAFDGTLWDDDANPAGQVPYTVNNGLATDHAYVNLTLASPLVPEEAMGAFIGEDPNGTWTITISDDAGGDGGSLSSWALDLDTFACPLAGADLAITKDDGVTTAVPGETTTYTIVATNNGPASVSPVTVSDTFPAECESVSFTSVAAGGATGNTSAGSGNINDTALDMPAGSSVTYQAACSIDPAATGNLVNTANIGNGDADPNTDNNVATDTDTLTPQADLSITKTDGTTTVDPGGSTTYTIVGSSAGPSDVVDATVTDTFQAGLTCTWTCSGADGGTCTGNGSGNIGDTVDLPAGGSVTYLAQCTVAPGATMISNTASVAAPAGVTDPTSENNSATDANSVPVAAIPTAGAGAMMLLAALLAGVAFLALRARG